MNRLFLDEIEPRDQTYGFIRDHPDGAEAKAFLERLWSFYFPYADANFKSAFGLYEPNPPRVLQALFPLGNLVATLHRTTNGWGASIDYSYQDEIEKKSGCPVSMNVFRDPTYDVISAVLFCPSNVWCRPPRDTEVGLDFMLIHNPVAKNQIPHRWLKCGRECWVEDNHLVINDWCKEHPSWVRDTEPTFTLEEAIQKNNARRGVTGEMLEQWRRRAHDGHQL